jgi:DNA polymerase III delta subunit
MNPPESVSPAPKIPQVSILHGDDDFAMEQEVKRIQAALGLAVSASDTSIQSFEDRPFNDPEMQRAAQTPDLFSPKRLVILKDPVFPRSKKKKTGDSDEQEDFESKDNLVSEKFIHMLDELDEKTYFVIAVADEFKGYKEKGKWKVLGPGYWLTRWVQKSKGKAEISAFKLPDMKEINAWILAEGELQGGKINPQAAAELTFHFGNDTRILSQEITKLLIYVDRKHPVEVGDVKDLCNYGGEGNIFNMIDSLANGDARSAMVQYHLLLQEGDPASIFAMIVRQFRQLILTQEMATEQKSEGDIAIEFKIPDFAARKLMQQTRRFTSARLAEIYHRLLEIDTASKTNAGMPLDVAIDTFIQEMGR